VLRSYITFYDKVIFAVLNFQFASNKYVLNLLLFQNFIFAVFIENLTKKISAANFAAKPNSTWCPSIVLHNKILVLT